MTNLKHNKDGYLVRVTLEGCGMIQVHFDSFNVFYFSLDRWNCFEDLLSYERLFKLH